MSSTEYRQLLERSLEEFGSLSKEREEIDAKLLNLRHFIYATVNMLPDREKSLYQAELAEFASQMGNLTDSVRETLKLATQRDCYWTATEVRDQLKNAGFDFSQYTSNPLSSVNTVLRRFKPSEVETIARDGVMSYRWVSRIRENETEPGHRRSGPIED
jgi:hypothetical protein